MAQPFLNSQMHCPRGPLSPLLFENRQRGFQHSVGIERNTVDALLDQEPRELRIVAGRLSADADLAAPRAACRDDLSDHLLQLPQLLIEILINRLRS